MGSFLIRRCTPNINFYTERRKKKYKFNKKNIRQFLIMSTPPDIYHAGREVISGGHSLTLCRVDDPSHPLSCDPVLKTSSDPKNYWVPKTTYKSYAQCRNDSVLDNTNCTEGNFCTIYVDLGCDPFQGHTDPSKIGELKLV